MTASQVKRHFPESPLIGVCVAIWRGDSILLARRGREPHRDRWAMPGGLVELGESLEVAARREVLEETALHMDWLRFNRFHEIIRTDQDGAVETHYVLAMFFGEAGSGEAEAGDDAAAVGWYDHREINLLDLTPSTLEFVAESRAAMAVKKTA